MTIPTRLVLRWLSRAGPALALAAAGNWLKDPISGCAVWTEIPSGKETISWSGDCEDGHPSQALLTHMLRNGG